MTYRCVTSGEARRRVQRKRDACISVLLAALTCFVFILLLLALRSGVGHWSRGAPVIRIQYKMADDSVELEKPERFDPYRAPVGPSNVEGLRNRMIEAVAIGEYSIPRFTPPVEPTGWLENMQDNDFGMGVGAAGMGEASGTFFGIQRNAQRFVFVLDFSSSMDEGWAGDEATEERSRIGSLKREVIRSIRSLPRNSEFAVIFFHDHYWTLDDPSSAGSTAPSGTNLTWRFATQKNKFLAIDRITFAQPGGGTYWSKPLLEGLSMSPKPQVLYLLSDGEPSDWDEMKREFVKIKMRGVAIDTIALESEDEGAARLKALAQKTGGSYRRIRRGRVVDSIESKLHKFRSGVER